MYHNVISYLRQLHKRRELQQPSLRLEIMNLKIAGLIIACFVGMVYAPSPYGQQNQRGYQQGGYQQSGSQQGCRPYNGPPPSRFPACKDYDSKIYNELRGKLYFSF